TESQPDESFGKSSSKGGVFLHLVRVPHGPSLTFSVCEYSLKRDVTTLVRRVFDSNQFRTPPLLAMTGFGSLCPDAPGPKQPQPPPPHLRLLVDMFQNMLPPLNVQKLKLSTVRRILLISREVDLSTTSDEKNQNPDDVIYIRHYHIHTENRSISRALRRLSMGGARTKKRRVTTGLDSLSGDCVKGTGVSQCLARSRSLVPPWLVAKSCRRAGMLSDSGLSDALSDMEEVDLPQTQVAVSDAGTPVTLTTAKKRKFVPAHGLRHLGTAKRATVRLTEIGPRLTLKLIKIEEGLNTGIVLYHRWHSRSLTEVADQAERLRQREALRASRRAEHEARRAANEAAREAHRQACLEGMRRAGQLPWKPSSNASETEASDGEDRDSDENTNDEGHSQAEVHLGKKKVRHDKHSIPAVVGSKARKHRCKVILPVRGSLVTPKKTNVRLAGVNKGKLIEFRD
ncbi:Peter pan, partial [Fasciola gigantica]